MISCHDQRPTDEIADYLMCTPQEDIDLLAVCTILCRRISALEEGAQANKEVEPKREDHGCKFCEHLAVCVCE